MFKIHVTAFFYVNHIVNFTFKLENKRLKLHAVNLVYYSVYSKLSVLSVYCKLSVLFCILYILCITLYTVHSQLSIKACPNTWLPKTLTSVQLQPIIAELCPAIVTYSPSNHSPQYKNIKLFLSLVLSKLIQKLVIALSWNN